MHWVHFKTARWLFLLAAVAFCIGLSAQEADNEFTIDAKINTRGEIRVGGFNSNQEDDNERMAHFIMGQYRLNLGYKRGDWLEIRLSPQFSGVWGQAGGTLNLSEGWLSMKHNKSEVFAKIGRQVLEYDDERILGYDDWTMTAPTHDALKFGYEGYGHKVHLLLAYNQNAENISTGINYYSGGIQPYKTMQTLWYHYDTPKSLFGFSPIGMNIGMESQNPEFPNKTFYQQLVGTYVTLKPSIVFLEGSFYYQMGKEENGKTLDAFMGSAKIKVTPSEIYNLYAGYDYLSSDQFPVPINGGFGLIFHDKTRGFTPLFGSHHQFYGTMDFFYLNSYVNYFSPGLQNLYTGGTVSPVKGLKINAAYHFYAIAADLNNLKKPLGHEIAIDVGYTFAKFVKVAAGYSYMRGTETMEILQRVTENRRLHWGWVMLSVTPTIFTKPWNDKKRLREAVQATFNNRPLLFSRITTDENGEPVMVLHEPEPIDIKIQNIQDIEQEKAALLLPMQLNGGPLYRVQILCSPEQVCLFMDLHHIVCDGTTMNIILHDILKAYEGKALEPEKIGMAEVTRTEIEQRQGEDFQQARDWYLKTFDCSDVDTTLLPDSNLRDAGERVMERTLSIRVQEVEAFGKANGVFKSNYFTAAYALLLAKTAGEEDTDTDLDTAETIVSMFRKQAAATPDNIAVVYKDNRYTYREVDEISDRIAAYILGQGLQGEDVVSVLIPRCEWMAMASLGVTKAGCAYQPLDPTCPAERLNFMMKDASAKLLIADETLRPIVNEYQGTTSLTKDIPSLPCVEANSQLFTLNAYLHLPFSSCSTPPAPRARPRAASWSTATSRLSASGTGASST